MSRVISFIGLGTMGGPMALRLARADFVVRGFDLDPKKTNALVQAGGATSRSVAEACEGADTIITMLPRDEHVRSALLGSDGATSAANNDALVLEMSTISPVSSLEVAAELKASGLRMMDAPVGRRPADARAGTLLVMAGGEREDFEEAKPVFDAFADKALHMGPLGSGIRMKVANNYMSMVSMVLTAETLTMARKAGIDSDAAVEVLQNTVAGKGQINTNFPNKVLSGDITPDFPLALGTKDLTLAMGMGHDLQVPLFLGGSAREVFGLAPGMGRAEQDCTAMLLILEQLAGLEPRVSDRPGSDA